MESEDAEYQGVDISTACFFTSLTSIGGSQEWSDRLLMYYYDHHILSAEEDKSPIFCWIEFTLQRTQRNSIAHEKHSSSRLPACCQSLSGIFIFPLLLASHKLICGTNTTLGKVFSPPQEIYFKSVNIRSWTLANVQKCLSLALLINRVIH